METSESKLEDREAIGKKGLRMIEYSSQKMRRGRGLIKRGKCALAREDGVDGHLAHLVDRVRLEALELVGLAVEGADPGIALKGKFRSGRLTESALNQVRRRNGSIGE